MNSTPTALPSPARFPASFRSQAPAMFLALVLAALLGWQGWQGWLAYRAKQLPGTPASAQAIEARWGVRLTHIAVLADGGLIDFRFQTIDPDKAAPLFNLENRPLLFVERTGQEVDSLYHPPHGHEFAPGESHYFLYNNRGGAIRPGDRVTVVLGDLRLEHIVAK